MTEKKSSEVDKIIGNKVYNLRISNRLTRKYLADAIGVTCQQLQKYENGINRISVGRLVLIAEALNVTIEYFFKGVTDEVDPTIYHQQLVGFEFLKNFAKIRNPKHQKVVNTLVKLLAKEVD